jgi:hypothetical protein
MSMYVRTTIIAVAFSAFHCMGALAQSTAVDAEFAIDSWPGSPEQAALLATETVDPAWSQEMESRIVDAVRAVADWPTLDHAQNTVAVVERTAIADYASR